MKNTVQQEIKGLKERVQELEEAIKTAISHFNYDEHYEGMRVLSEKLEGEE